MSNRGGEIIVYIIETKGDLMQSFMKRLVQHRDLLSKLEIEVLNYISHFPEKVVSLTLSEAADLMYVSTATISRTCKKLGFAGYQDFKFQLQLYLKDDLQSEKYLTSPDLQDYVKRYENDLNEVLKRVDENKLQAAANMIANANHIEWFGVGHSYPVCWDASKKLQLLCKKSTARIDWDDLRSATRSMTNNDLAIFISYSGETLNIVEFAHLVKHQGVPILSFLGTAENRLTELSDLFFYTPIENHYVGELDLSFRAPFQILVDLVLVKYYKQFL